MQKYLFILLFATSLFAREYIAIIDFEGIGITNDEARVLTQRLTSEMINIGVYQVLERSEMNLNSIFNVAGASFAPLRFII